MEPFAASEIARDNLDVKTFKGKGSNPGPAEAEDSLEISVERIFSTMPGRKKIRVMAAEKRKGRGM